MRDIAKEQRNCSKAIDNFARLFDILCSRGISPDKAAEETNLFMGNYFIYSSPHPIMPQYCDHDGGDMVFTPDDFQGD